MTLYLSIILSVPTLIITSWYFFVAFRHRTFIDKLIFISIILVLTSCSFFGFYAYQISAIWGISHYIFPFLVSLGFVIGRILAQESEPSKNEYYLFVPLITFLMVTIVMFVSAIPIAVFPYYSEPIRSTTMPELKELSADPIIDNLSKIKRYLSDVELQLSEQSSNIDDLSTGLREFINEQNTELAEIFAEQEKVLAELDYYKSLASLSEEQSQAIIQALERNRYLDYVIGILIGLCTGGLFFLIQHFYFRRLKIIEPRQSQAKPVSEPITTKKKPKARPDTRNVMTKKKPKNLGQH